MKLQIATKKIVYQTLLALLVLVWCYATASKAIAFRRFTAQLSQHPFFKHWYHWVAIGLLLAEAVTAILLFFRITQRWALWASLWLLLSFTLYIAAMVIWMPKLPCSCGGIIEHLGWKGHIVFNCLLMGITAAALHLHRTGAT